MIDIREEFDNVTDCFGVRLRYTVTDSVDLLANAKIRSATCARGREKEKEKKLDCRK